MKGSLVLTFSALASVLALPSDLDARAQPKGFDVSNYQKNINWKTAKSNGAEFVFIKVCGYVLLSASANILQATEGTTYKSPAFNLQYTGATNNGLIRGAYHYAQPSMSSGAAQAKYFIAHGGGWSSDERTLPGMVDLEDGCSGLSQAAMVQWIRDFVRTYHSATTRYPLIYTTTSWWKSCTGNDAGFGKSPLVIARWGNSLGELPASWKAHTFWQFADKGVFPGDQELFNGNSVGLKRLATG